MSVHLRSGSRLQNERRRFSFDGRTITAQAGDTVGSALLANDVRLLGRSVKYRRPRGMFTCNADEPNALMTIGAPPCVTPNLPAPQLAVVNDLIVRSQNRWPSLRFDLHSLLRLGSEYFGAGFYYKTFMWPSWRFWEGLIRRLAGLGDAPGVSTLATGDVEHLSCDVFVAGGGAAGLMAALTAARAGAHVVLCERDVQCGGELEFENATIGGQTGAQWVLATLHELQMRGARVLTEAAFVADVNGVAHVHQGQGGAPGADLALRIRARAVVLALGAHERPIAFVDNDAPGVMLLGAAERLRSCYGVVPGSELVLFGSHDRLYAAASRFLAAGRNIRAVIDTRAQPSDLHAERLRDELQREGVECLCEHAVIEARGGQRLSGIAVASLADPASAWPLRCDALLVSGGWTPNVHAVLQGGGQAPFQPEVGALLPQAQPPGRFVCGSARAHFTIQAVLADAHSIGLDAASYAGRHGEMVRVPAASGDGQPHVVAFWRSPSTLRAEKRQFVDLQNDVTVADIRQAVAEGFRDIEHVKRYTTLGVGTDQGRIGGQLGAAVLAEFTGADAAPISRPRPPYQPVSLQALTGLRTATALRPERRTPLHAWHVDNGGELESMGWWTRPRYYRANGADAFRAGIAEAARVRAHGGVVDGSTLGKIEVVGVDAAAFLDRMYLNKASTIKVGRSKYMVMLREDGMVLDDGVVLRLAEDRFVATTSSAHAGRVLSHFELWRELEWSDRRIALADVTEAWAVIVVAGPRSREALRHVLGAEWLESLNSLSHMQFVCGSWRATELRVLRASFSGELAFELHCRPSIAAPLWEALIATGLCAYGIEALDILRLEKGYLVGAELNGQTTPLDLNMEAMLKLDNACIGRALLDRPAFRQPNRWRLVGVQAKDASAKFLAGAQIVVSGARERSVGHVTSSVYSPALQRWVGLALMARNADEGGLIARDPIRGLETQVIATSPVHFDPTGERMKA